MTIRPVEIIIGLITVVLAGLAVGPLVECSTKGMDLRSPPGVPNQWEEVTKVRGAGQWIGLLEQILFFAAFWLDEPLIIGGYLAFKVASKWATWQHIVRVPESIERISPLSYLEARKNWSSLMLTRFLVGTLANILIGLFGFVSGKNGIAVIKFLWDYLSL